MPRSRIVWLVYAVIIMLICGYNGFTTGKMGQGLGCNVSIPMQNHKMCDLLDQLTAAKDEFRFLVALILAAYVGRSFSGHCYESLH
jgi:hypothetical protein